MWHLIGGFEANQLAVLSQMVQSVNSILTEIIGENRRPQEERAT